MTRRIPLSEVGALTRRRAMARIGAAAAMRAFTARAANFEPLPIALPEFDTVSPADVELARAILQIITGNLSGSTTPHGVKLFAPIDPAAFIEKTANCDAVPRFSDWRAVNAQALLTGCVTQANDGSMTAAFRLWDVLGKTQLIGEFYHFKPVDFRRVANAMSDVIYERLTGAKGNFDASGTP